MQPFITVDNGNLKNMSLLEFTRAISGTSDTYLTSVQTAYRTVPWLYRGTVKRASSISRLPYSIHKGGTDVTEDPDIKAFTRWLRTMLYLTGESRTLYGASYHLIESNPFGYKAKPRHIPTPAVMPNFTDNELTSITISGMNNGNEIPIKRVAWSWLPNSFSETRPGEAPASVALRAAGLLAAIDDMSTVFFKNGAVPITAVSVPPTMNKEDREKLENWFSRFATGVRSMFKFMAVNKDTTFTQIGHSIRDSQVPELTDDQRKNVAVAMGVPPSVIDGTAANFATAESDTLGYVLDTVIPEGEQIQEHLNATMFERFGLELEFEFEQLEVIQAMQLEQAKAITELTGGKPVLSQRTGMEWAGLDPDEEFKRMEDEKAKNPPPAPPPQFGQQQPQAGSAPAPDDIPEADTPDPDQMKTWRDAALAAVKGGSPATVGTPFDGELAAASSGRMVRDVFERHWPKETETDDWRKTAIKELARFNALAEGALSNG